jgi:hypothetical protein
MSLNSRSNSGYRLHQAVDGRSDQLVKDDIGVMHAVYRGRAVMVYRARKHGVTLTQRDLIELATVIPRLLISIHYFIFQ